MKHEGELLALTPEHVEIRLAPAGLGSRFVACLVDLLLIVAAYLTVKLLLAFMGAFGEAFSFVAWFVLHWGYHLYFETRHWGRTLGKRMLNLRVVDRRGLPLSVQQSFVRNIVRALDMLPLLYALGALACFLDKHHRRLGDLAADTLVIQESQPLEYAGVLADARMHNSLRTARVLRLIRHRISLDEREFLLTLCLRARGLHDKARFDLMEDAGAYFCRKLEIDDPHLSGENLVRGLTAVLYENRQPS